MRTNHRRAKVDIINPNHDQNTVLEYMFHSDEKCDKFLLRFFFSTSFRETNWNPNANIEFQSIQDNS